MTRQKNRERSLCLTAGWNRFKPVTALAACLLAVAFLLSGCAPLLIGGVTGGAIAGGEYARTATTSRTVDANLKVTKLATEKALEQMGMEPRGPIYTDTGAKFSGSTPQLDIIVELERVNPRATKIVVDAKAGFLQRDEGAANEILRRTVANLEIPQ
jgi:hypothetical protein